MYKTIEDVRGEIRRSVGSSFDPKLKSGLISDVKNNNKKDRVLGDFG